MLDLPSVHRRARGGIMGNRLRILPEGYKNETKKQKGKTNKLRAVNLPAVKIARGLTDGEVF